MSKKLMRSKDPDIIASYAALRRAAKRALQIGLETGTPVYVLENGEIVDLTKRYRRKAKPRQRQSRELTHLGE
jgi:mRNA degradation ribonuclease J1/J2